MIPWGEVWDDWDLEEVITWEVIDELMGEETRRQTFTETIKGGRDPFAKPQLII